MTISTITFQEASLYSNNPKNHTIVGNLKGRWNFFVSTVEGVIDIAQGITRAAFDILRSIATFFTHSRFKEAWGSIKDAGKAAWITTESLAGLIICPHVARMLNKNVAPKISSSLVVA